TSFAVVFSERVKDSSSRVDLKTFVNSCQISSFKGWNGVVDRLNAPPAPVRLLCGLGRPARKGLRRLPPGQCEPDTPDSPPLRASSDRRRRVGNLAFGSGP